MNEKYIVLVIGVITLILIGCSSPLDVTLSTQSTPTEPPPSQLPAAIGSLPAPVTVTPKPLASGRVVVLSLDGIAATTLLDHVNMGDMPAVETLIETSAWGSTAGISITTSAVGHYSLACGCYPADHGITGERLHRPQDPFYWYTSAYDLPTESTLLWQNIEAQGGTTAALFWPGATTEMPEQMPGHLITYGERLAYSDVHQIALTDSYQWSNAPDSTVPLLEGEVTVTNRAGSIATIHMLAFGRSPDEYDSVIVSVNDRVVEARDAMLTQGEWGSVLVESDPLRGTVALLQSVNDTSLSIYIGNIYEIDAEPHTVVSPLFDGMPIPVVPPPDYYALQNDWITDQNYLDMIALQADWIAELTVRVYEVLEPDLLISVFSPMKQAGHQFLLIDDRQPAFTQNSDIYLQYRRVTATIADRTVSYLVDTMSEDLLNGSASLLTVSPSGMAPIHTQVNLNTFLTEIGLLTLQPNNYVIVPQSQAIAFASGGTGHIYFNIRGRERAGIVAETDLDAIRTTLVTELETLIDPQSGERVFAHVLSLAELEAFHLQAPYTGDIVVIANPGYLLSDDRESREVFSIPTFYGAGGYGNDIAHSQGFWLLHAQGITVGERDEPISLIQLEEHILSFLSVRE